ncbi:MAG: peptidase M28 [Candidatus Brocadia carolinensis]|uniref:Peptidase M28 n=1 Tax=Candidatus Brocadia carolinensis TaxID=1004156 RepID=A0A1V4AR19_9BACT|nr:MAG: peptidase M28 [Candidatus Brocadia caroliniensis]
MRKIISSLLYFMLMFVLCLDGEFLCGDGMEKGEEQFLSNVRQLTYQGKSAGEGYFSSDGKYLIFQSERDPENPFYQIYMMSLETGDTHRISPGTGKTTCSFFRPTSDDVLFASSHLDPDARAKQQAEIEFRTSGKKRRFTWDYDSHYDIFSTKRDGSALRRLTNALGYDAEGAYSPDGNKIVFCSLRDAYPVERLSPEDQKRMETNPGYFGEIYIMNSDGSDQKRLTTWEGYDGGPFFSPDGARIIWRHFNENGMLADIYTMKLDGSDRRRLTDFGSMSWAPYYHPSGEYIIFHSNKHGFTNCELFLVDTQGEKEPVRVTFTDRFDGLPVFSPDGKQLCWTSGRTSNGDSQLFMAAWNHEAAQEALKVTGKRSEAQTNQPTPLPSGKMKQGAVNEPVRKQSGEDRNDVHQFSPEITSADLQAQVSYLASDGLEGRMTGTRGTQMAAHYLAGYFNEIGLKPLGDKGSYFQEFPFISGSKLITDQNHFQLRKEGDEKKTITFEVEKDFLPLAFTANGEVDGEVVFAGYGLSVPGNEANRYDSYAGIDVKDKIVLVLHHVPEKVDMKRHLELSGYASLRYKAMLARERGAKALLVVIGPGSSDAGKLIPLSSSDKASADSGISVVSISGPVAETLFVGSGRNLKDVQSELDVENPQTEGSFSLPKARVKIVTAVEQIRETDRNVLGFLPPGEGSEGAECIVVGAHYDHIGYGGVDSLAHKGEEGQIHNGADDNASGVSLVLELASSLAEERRKNPRTFKRGIVFALWSGEELGCLGSSYFVGHPMVPLKNVIAYMNFDMVGRLRENNLIVEGVGSSNSWSRLIEKANVKAGFHVNLLHDPYQPSDVASFYPKGIPVIHFFTGVHEDYNRPTDDHTTLNYDGMVRVAGFARSMLIDLIQQAERPDYVKVKESEKQRTEKIARKTSWGTVPDFAAETKEGVKISTVKKDGPADKAGMRDGDVVVEIAGNKITNLYDYNYLMDIAGFGKPIEVVVLRNGSREKLTIVPVVRK